MVIEAGYDGVLSWEYEAWLWAASPPSIQWNGPAAADAVGAHQRYVRTLLAD